ncbi:pilus assembly protein PilP [Melittangium boletus]|uniref:Type IV pilus biogenesis protein PilP n=1 Tax=Melittangium boletus DSM 14713 TaxID=1294270 RepID=A0A250I9U4_9BACT|nr:pilus assembly protein PilP [Melittangium boletus]ATB27983.1 type IV pilus biogenesis protein PilP [Melittangium boletus DSM 14713]
MKTIHSMLMSGALALSLAGCGEDAPPPPPPPVAKPAQAEAPKPKPAETTATASTYVYNYNPVGKRDPFRSPIEDMVRESPTAGSSGPPCNEALCQWDIDQLKLVAVVTGDANPMAMVEDPMGRGHVVRRNTRMGRQGGKVTQILRDEVVVTETITTPERVVYNPVKLGLKQEVKMDPAYNLMTGKNWEQ